MDTHQTHRPNQCSQKTHPTYFHGPIRACRRHVVAPRRHRRHRRPVAKHLHAGPLHVRGVPRHRAIRVPRQQRRSLYVLRQRLDCALARLLHPHLAAGGDVAPVDLAVLIPGAKEKMVGEEFEVGGVAAVLDAVDLDAVVVVDVDVPAWVGALLRLQT